MREYILCSFIFLIASSCENDKPLSFTKEYGSHRSIASAEEPECFVDKFDLDKINSEINILEKGISKLKLKNKDFDFLDLSYGQIKFLNDHSELIDTDKDYHSCKDFYCLLNLNYLSETKEEAYRIYHFYLNTGIAIDTNGVIPEFRSELGRYDLIKQEGETSLYLFDKEELYALNLSSNVLASKYNSLSVNSLHRTKKGEYIEWHGLSYTSGRFHYTFPMGTAYSGYRKKRGFIHLSDEDVKLSDKTIKGGFPHTYIHELTHALDYTYGEDKSFEDLSYQTKWYELSWERQDLSLASSVESNLVRKVGQDNFISSYAKTSVKEDFADHGAYFIIAPEKMKLKAPKKYDYFKDNIYSKEFDVESIKLLTVAQLKSHMLSQVYEFVAQCEKTKTSTYMGAHFLDNLPPGNFTRCLEDYFAKEFQIQSQEIKRDTYSGCKVDSSYGGEIKNAVFEEIKIKLDDILKTHNSFIVIAQKIEKYQQELSDYCPADTFLLDSPIPSREVYELNLKNCVESIVTSLDPLILESENNKFFHSNDYDKVKYNVDSLLATDLKNLNLNIDSFLENMINVCKAGFQESLRKDEPLAFSFLSLNIDFNNCLNLYILENEENFYEENFSFDNDKFNNAFVEFSRQSRSILIKKLFKMLNDLNEQEMLVLNKFPRGDVENALLLNNTILDQVLNHENSSRFDICTSAFREPATKTYQDFFLKNNIRTYHANDFVNEQLFSLCEKVKLLNSSNEASILIKEKDSVLELKVEILNFENSFNDNNEIYFSQRVFEQKCVESSGNFNDKFKLIPQSIKNICLAIWRDGKSSSLDEFIIQVECLPTCQASVKSSKYYSEILKRIDLSIDNKISLAGKDCSADEDLKSCVKKRVFTNESKEHMVLDFILDFEPELKEFAKSEFLKRFFMRSIKY